MATSPAMALEAPGQRGAHHRPIVASDRPRRIPRTADPPSPRAPRRVLRLVILICSAGVPIARAQEDPHQARALVEIQKMFPEVERDASRPGRPVVGLLLNSNRVSDAGLAHLVVLAQLQRLTILSEDITDAGLAHLKGLAQLRSLDIHCKGITDAGLAHLNGLAELRQLDVYSLAVTDAGLAHLEGLARLQSLSLLCRRVGDAGLARLEGLTQLRTLGLGGTRVTDAGLVHLRGLAQLRELDLSGTAVTDAGLAHLVGLSGLRSLGLRGTAVTDAATGHLVRLTQLQQLDLGGTQVTDKALARLEGLPELEKLDARETMVTDAARERLEQLPRFQADKHRLRATRNLIDIGLQMHFYHARNATFPPAAIKGKDGRPLLSWRVALLPYLGYGELFDEFRLDEPWDGPHNRKLLERIPKEYRAVHTIPKEPYSTYWRGFVGGHTFFGPIQGDGPRFSDIKDGSANTLMLVEAGEAVPWTKPDELTDDPHRPLPKLGGEGFSSGFCALFADGAVRTLSRHLDDKITRTLITRDGGEYVQRREWEQR